MKKLNLLIFALFILVSILGLTLFLRQTDVPSKSLQQSQPQLPPEPERQGIVHYPVPVPLQSEQPAAAEQPALAKEPVTEAAAPPLPEKLPPVEQSDQSFEEALTSLKLKSDLLQLLLLDNFIQRFVTTVDNLPEKKLARAHIPLLPPKGRFLVDWQQDQPQTSKHNWARYEKHVQFLERLDPQLVVKIYIHFYPLFQTAFEQLGYKNAYFNDRLVYVIDHLLQTPDPDEPQLLEQPSVLFSFVDPLLEQLSFGQKTLLRIGPENRRRVKAVLQQFRRQLVNLQP